MAEILFCKNVCPLVENCGNYSDTHYGSIRERTFNEGKKAISILLPNPVPEYLKRGINLSDFSQACTEITSIYNAVVLTKDNTSSVMSPIRCVQSGYELPFACGGTKKE